MYQTDVTPSESPFATDPSDVIDFKGLVCVFNESRSAVASKVYAMELVLDRTTLRLETPPRDAEARRQLVIVVPELGGLRMPGSHACYRRSWAEAYRSGGLPAAVQYLSIVHSWLQECREQQSKRKSGSRRSR